MHPLIHRTLLLCGLLLCLAQLPAHARTIDWGNGIGDILVDSNNVALDSGFTFELGTFGSFVPTLSNHGDWVANWKVFDRAVAPGANGWNPAAGYFSSSATLLTGTYSSESPPLPSFTFAEGEQAYIWIYDSLAFDYVSEWALITNNALDGTTADDWLMPAVGGKTDMPLEWRVSDATVVIYGGVNNTQGDGNYTVDPGTFAIQTHVVPEPAGMVLVLLGLVAGWFPRRR